MSLTYGILGFLSYGNMTGYELAKAFNSSVNFVWYAQTSQIYLELGKLEKKQYVTSELVIQSDKPNKKLYQITENGKEAFLNWLSENHDEIHIKNEFLMKLFFCGSNTREMTILKLKQFSQDCQNYLDKVEGVPPALVVQYKQLVAPKHSLYWDCTREFVLEYMRMCMNWAETCIKKIEQEEELI